MARLNTNDRARVREVTSWLTTFEENSPPALSAVVERLPKLLDAEYTASYGVSVTHGHARLDFMHMQRIDRASEFVTDLRAWLAKSPLKFGYYDPAGPESWQRNRSLRIVDCQRYAPSPPPPLFKDFLPRWGLEESDQLRVLLCEGPALIAWVGGFRREKFGERERSILAALVPPLHRRVLLERALGLAAFRSSAMSTALEALGAPAFIVDFKGAIVHANSAGLELLDRERSRVMSELHDSIAHQDGAAPYATTPFAVAGARPHYLAQRRATSDYGFRVGLAAMQWKLTRRQHQVLALLARGFSNRAIGAELHCAERTVELHVTAILKKSGAQTRGELLARLISLG